MADWDLKPAADLGLAHKDRVRSIRRERSIFSGAVSAVWWAVIRLIMRWRHSFSVTGSEHLPADAPFVLVANHSSHLDVVSLMLTLPWRLRYRAYPLAAADHFFGEIPLATFTSFVLNALPMERQGGGKGRETIAYLRARMQAGGCGIVLFPEGTRSRTGAMGRFRSGVGMLVAGTSVPVVPCWIEGAFAAFPPDRKTPRPLPVRVYVGPPLRFPAAVDDKEGCESVAQAVEAAVRSLAPASTSGSPS